MFISNRPFAFLVSLFLLGLSPFAMTADMDHSHLQRLHYGQSRDVIEQSLGKSDTKETDGVIYQLPSGDPAKASYQNGKLSGFSVRFKTPLPHDRIIPPGETHVPGQMVMSDSTGTNDVTPSEVLAGNPESGRQYTFNPAGLVTSFHIVPPWPSDRMKRQPLSQLLDEYWKSHAPGNQKTVRVPPPTSPTKKTMKAAKGG